MRTSRTSAGCLMFRVRGTRLEVLLGHMGGPFWTKKDEGAWTTPKGEYDPAAEDALDVARREFEEEMGSAPPPSGYLDLGEVRQSGGKLVRIWAVEGEFDPATQVSNTFEIEWPPRSGKTRTWPEIDRAAWLDVEAARAKLVKAQAAFLDRLVAALRQSGRLTS